MAHLDALGDGRAAALAGRPDGRGHPALLGDRRLGEPEAAVGQGDREQPAEALLHRAERDPVLRALGARHGGLDLAEVELDHVGERRLRGRPRAEEALLLAVALDEADLPLVAAGEPQVAQRLVVHGEEAHGRAVLGRHVRHRRTVGEGHGVEAGAEELDELVDDALLAQHLGHGEHEVRRGDALAHLAREPHPDDARGEHVDGLAEHDRLGLDAAHAPAHDAEAVDHRRVRVGPDAAVGQGDGPAADHPRLDHAREVLEVDLVDDARRGRHGAEAAERLLAPLEEAVALAVAGELDLDVLAEGVGRPERVHLHAVVDHEVHRDQRVDLPRGAAEALHGVAHRREVDHAGHAGEVLEHDARGAERHLHGGGRLRVPAREPEHVLLGDDEAVHVAQRRLEDHADRVREAIDARHAGLAQGVQAEQVDRPGGGGEGGAGAERVLGGGHGLSGPGRARGGREGEATG